MSDAHKSLRLGDLLVEKGLITRAQLRQAIEIQQALQTTQASSNANARKELGSILVELGFISSQQLQSNLNWQRRLKATTAVMVFIAPLLTAACGGGAAGTSQTSGFKTEASSLSVASNVSPKPEPVSSSSSSSLAVISSSSSEPKSVSSSSLSSSSSLVSSNSSSSSSSVSSSSSSSSSSSPGVVEGAIRLYWSVPNQRENGEYLDVTEIGGYELRYKLKSENTYKTIHISDGFIDTYYFDYLKGDYEFQIATFDTNGLYSGFINLNPS